MVPPSMTSVPPRSAVANRHPGLPGGLTPRVDAVRHRNVTEPTLHWVLIFEPRLSDPPAGLRMKPRPADHRSGALLCAASCARWRARVGERRHAISWYSWYCPIFRYHARRSDGCESVTSRFAQRIRRSRGFAHSGQQPFLTGNQCEAIKTRELRALLLEIPQEEENPMELSLGVKSNGGSLRFKIPFSF